MTGPDGDKHHGWWEVVAVDPPHRLELEDGFADDERDAERRPCPRDGRPARRAARGRRRHA